MKKIHLVFSLLLVTFLLVFACKKKPALDDDTVTMGELASEQTSLTTTTGGSTTGGSTTGGSTTGGTTTGGSTTGGTTTGGSTTGGPAMVDWIFWADSGDLSTAGGVIYIVIDNTHYISITTGYPSSPSCGVAGAGNITLPAGDHTWYAVTNNQQYYWGNQSAPRMTTLVSGCQKTWLNI